MKTISEKNKIQKLILSNQIKDAIESLSGILSRYMTINGNLSVVDKFYDELSLLSEKLGRILELKNLGITDEETTSIEIERLQKPLLSILEKLPDEFYIFMETERKEEYIWKEVKDINSVSAYNSYLKKYPKGRFVNEASYFKQKLEILKRIKFRDQELGQYEASILKEKEERDLWKNVKIENTIEAYDKYLNKYPKGKFINDAKVSKHKLEVFAFRKEKELELEELERKMQNEKAEKQAWQIANNQNTISAYEIYLTQYPEAYYSEKSVNLINVLKEKERKKKKEAAERKIRLQEENDTWDLVSLEDSIIAYNSYMKKYPNGRYIKQAEVRKKRIEVLEQRRQAELELEKLNSIIKKEKDEKNLWEKAKRTYDLDLFREYINTYPEGRYITKARKLVIELELKKRKEEKEREEQKEKEVFEIQSAPTIIDDVKEKVEIQQENKTEELDDLQTYLAQLEQKKNEADKKAVIPNFEEPKKIIPEVPEIKKEVKEEIILSPPVEEEKSKSTFAIDIEKKSKTKTLEEEKAEYEQKLADLEQETEKRANLKIAAKKKKEKQKNRNTRFLLWATVVVVIAIVISSSIIEYFDEQDKIEADKNRKLDSIENIAIRKKRRDSLSQILATEREKGLAGQEEKSKAYQDSIAKIIAEEEARETQERIEQENAEFLVWWNELSDAWKSVLSKKAGVSGKMTMSGMRKIFNIKTLDINGNKDIANLEPLRKLSSLKKLKMQDTNITSLEPLSYLENLTELFCKGSQVTKEDVQQYRKAHSSCFVID